MRKINIALFEDLLYKRMIKKRIFKESSLNFKKTRIISKILNKNDCLNRQRLPRSYYIKHQLFANENKTFIGT